MSWVNRQGEKVESPRMDVIGNETFDRFAQLVAEWAGRDPVKNKMGSALLLRRAGYSLRRIALTIDRSEKQVGRYLREGPPAMREFLAVERAA